jgi:two-component system OmpR family sensor kinase
MRRHRTLRSRLFLWFLGAIVLAMATSALVVVTTRPEPVTGVETVARNVAGRLAATWDDADATRAYVGEVRDVTGFDARLLRDLRELPRGVRRVADRGGVIVPLGPQHFVVPVVRGADLVGALELERLGPRPQPWAWWRFGLALLLVVIVLSAMAGRVANQLAAPLEHLAGAADRFGGGDLAFRTDIARGTLRWTVREVRDVAVSFNRMADRVEAMVRGQRELLGAISHELRSPLGRARVALEIARDRLPPDDASERSPARALDDVDRQLGAVDTLLGDLLDVTRAGLADLRRERRPLAAWLKTCIAEEPQPPPIALTVAPDAADAVASIDAALLARAVHNLLVNARAHGHPADAPVEVAVARQGDLVRVTVRDRGAGFPEGFAERAFEPFVRGDAARARPAEGAGYGLGLAIVRRVVEAHGGRAFARSAPGGGAEVGFDLPAAPPPR